MRRFGLRVRLHCRFLRSPRRLERQRRPAAAEAQLTQTVQGAGSSGLISGGTTSTLRGEITAVWQAVASGSGDSAAWSRLNQSIQTGWNQGTIPRALPFQLLSALSYLSEMAGS